jgi:hypothetical protein
MALKKEINSDRFFVALRHLIMNEIYASGPSVNGNITFRGGPYGYGNKNQLAAPLNPATKKLEDEEQEELNQNVEDLHQGLGLYPQLKGSGVKMPQDIHLKERAEDDQQYGHLPGFPKMNALEDPKQFLPDENFVAYGKEQPEGTEEYLIDDIIDDFEQNPEDVAKRVEDRVFECLLKELGAGGGSAGGGNYPYSAKSYFPPFRNNDDILDPIDKRMGHIGWQNAENVSTGGYGSVLFPKKFVPDEANQESHEEDEDMDGIPDNVDKDQKPELDQKLEEKFASKAQARFFYAQAGKKRGKEGKKWKKWTKEFSDKTPNISALPDKKKTKKKK